MKNIRKNGLRGRGGFTLAELLIVVAIITVTAAVGFLAVSSFRRDREAKACDDTAKQIFVAVQNRMLQMKEYGEWDAFRKAHQYTPSPSETSAQAAANAAINDLKYYGQKLENEPSDYGYWKGVTGGGSYSADDFRVFSTDDTGLDTDSLLKTLLSGGGLDEMIAGNHYRIEYNLETATVYGVFYSENQFEQTNSANAFKGIGTGASKDQYFGTVASNDNGRTVADNESAARKIRKEYKEASDSKSVIIGYFGGGMISGLTYEDVAMPEVIVYNGEDLILHIENKETDEGTFRFADTEVAVKLKGTASGAEKEYRIIAANTDNYCLQEADDSTKKLSIIKQWDLDKNGQNVGSAFDIVLDSYGKPGNTGKATEGSLRFKDIFTSAGLLPGEDLEITVRVSLTGPNQIGLPAVRTVKTNSLFASVSECFEKTSNEYSGGIEINAFRHLMNLNSASGVNFRKTSIFRSRGQGGNQDAPYRRAYLSSNITFDGKGEDCLQFPAVASRNYQADKIAFQPISLTLNSTVSRFYLSGKEDDSAVDAPSYRIYDLSITGTSGNIGLFGSVTKDSTAPAGAKLQVSDLGIVRAAGTGGTVNDTVFKAENADAGSCLGAFVGYAACDVTISGCYSTVLLRAVQADAAAAGKTYNIGGLVGYAGGNLTVSKSYVSGRTTNGRYQADGNISFHTPGSTTNVGGLAGTVSGKAVIDSCYSVASIGNRDGNIAETDMKTGTFCIGGLVGSADEAKMKNSYFYAFADLPDQENLNGNEANISLGGLIGACSKSCTADDYCGYIEEYLFISDLDKTKIDSDTGTAQPLKPLPDDVLDIAFHTDAGIETFAADEDFNDDTLESLPAPLRKQYVRMQALSEAYTESKGTSFVTSAYDTALSSAYPYKDVTGLKHHFGDWSVQAPSSIVTVVCGEGVLSVNGVTEYRTALLPCGSTVNLSDMTVAYKDGYEKLAVLRTGSQIVGPSAGSSAWTYTTRGIDVTLTVNAGAISPLTLSAKTAAQESVFGYQDLPLEVDLMDSTKQSDGTFTALEQYDKSITLCFLWGEKGGSESSSAEDSSSYTWVNLGTAAAPQYEPAAGYQGLCRVDDAAQPVCSYYVNLKQADGTRISGMTAGKGKTEFNLTTDKTNHIDNGFIQAYNDKTNSILTTGHKPYLNRRAYYGKKVFMARAYAYVTGSDGKVVPWLRTKLSDGCTFSASLNRVPVRFEYDSADSFAKTDGESTDAKNIFGEYRILIEADGGSEQIAQESDNDKGVFYIEYEDPEFTDGTGGRSPAALFLNDGITGTAAARGYSNYPADAADADQQAKLTKLPTAEYYADGESGTGVLFRGWQDAGTDAGSGSLDFTDWNYSQFDREATADNGYYGPDLWVTDHNNDAGHKPDGEEMLVFENQETETGYSMVPHSGVKNYLQLDHTDGCCYFRPISTDPIILKARWWRELYQHQLQYNGGYTGR